MSFSPLSPSDCSVEYRFDCLNTTPSLHAHYRHFLATTDCSVPVSCIGTLLLGVLDSLNFSLVIKTTGSRSSLQKPKSDSRLLYAGCHLLNHQALSKFVPSYGNALGFDNNLWITTRQPRFRPIRLSDFYPPR